MKTINRAALTTLFVGLLMGFTAGQALATQPDPEHKVGICHRTASDTNPYVYIEVDEASLDAHLNNLPGHPAKTNEDGSPRNDYLADGPEDCEVNEPSPSPSPSPDPSPKPPKEPKTPIGESPRKDTAHTGADVGDWVLIGGAFLVSALAAYGISRKLRG